MRSADMVKWQYLVETEDEDDVDSLGRVSSASRHACMPRNLDVEQYPMPG